MLISTSISKKNLSSLFTILTILFLVFLFYLAPTIQAACSPIKAGACPPEKPHACSGPAPVTMCCEFSANECVGVNSVDPTFSDLYPQLLNAISLDQDLTTISGIISAILIPAFMFAGLILFTMLLYGGFLFLTAANNAEQVEKGKQIITQAFIGFLIVFTSYWVVEIIQLIFGLNIIS